MTAEFFELEYASLEDAIEILESLAGKLVARA